MSREKYTEFHRARMGVHMYPNEFVIRTMLGTYPGLQMTKRYEGARLLDLGFGDGRNLPLFHNLGVEIHGVEPDEELCNLVRERALARTIRAELRQGTNSSIPHPDDFFDYVVGSHSIYYVASEEHFSDNLAEISRVLRPGGWLVASLPDLENSVVRDALPLGDGHWRLTTDPFGLRNGVTFRVFSSPDDIRETFSARFTDISIGTFRDDWYGLLVSGFALVCRKL